MCWAARLSSLEMASVECQRGVSGRPTEAGLLLSFGNHGVECSRLEIPKGVQAEIAWKSCGLSSFGKRSGDCVWIRRSASIRFRGEHKGNFRKVDVGVSGEFLLGYPERLERCQCAGVDRNLADARPCLWGFDRSATVGGDDGFVDGQGGSLPVDVRPTQSARFAAPGAGGCDHPEADRVAGIQLQSAHQECPHLVDGRRSDAFGNFA